MKDAAAGKERRHGECGNFALAHYLETAGKVKIPLIEDGKPLAQMPEILLARFTCMMCFCRAGAERMSSARRATGIKNPKRFVRIHFSQRIPSEVWQNASCRFKSMGTVRLAINTIAGLMVLFGLGCFNVVW